MKIDVQLRSSKSIYYPFFHLRISFFTPLLKPNAMRSSRNDRYRGSRKITNIRNHIGQYVT